MLFDKVRDRNKRMVPNEAGNYYRRNGLQDKHYSIVISLHNYLLSISILHLLVINYLYERFKILYFFQMLHTHTHTHTHTHIYIYIYIYIFNC